MLNWNGDAVLKKVMDAATWGMDSVMSDCVTTAKGTVHRRTTILQGSIQSRPTVEQGAGVFVGFWGSFAVKYALWVEQGTGPHMIGPIYPRRKKALFWPGADHPVRSVGAFMHPGSRAYPYLVPAAERHYPSLAMRIGMRFRAA